MKRYFLLLIACTSLRGMEESELKRERTVLISEALLNQDERVVPLKKIKMAPKTAAEYATQLGSWIRCAMQYSVYGLNLNGWAWFVSRKLMRGHCVNERLSWFDDNQNRLSLAEVKELRNQLAACYKIHLMPFDDDIVPIMNRLFQRVRDDEKLQSALDHFKIAAQTDRIQRGEVVFPIMVFYPSAGKEAAQYLLNVMFDLFKDVRGLDIAPRFNRKITSLLYYAQGDGDYKTDTYAHYFELDRIHYRRDFEGESKDYYLVNPEALQIL